MFKYESLNQLVELQGCITLSNVRVAKNAKYTHSSIVDEFQECIVYRNNSWTHSNRTQSITFQQNYY